MGVIAAAKTHSFRERVSSIIELYTGAVLPRDAGSSSAENGPRRSVGAGSSLIWSLRLAFASSRPTSSRPPFLA